MFRALTLLCIAVAATLVPPAGRASGGRYAFVGGTPRQQAQVRHALAASSFDWSLVPATTIHIAPVAASQATPGEIWLDPDLLDAGPFAWGVVQHEYAHQVDFFLLTEPARTVLMHELGANTWCSSAPVRRGALGCERFATALAWAYWPSANNVMRLASPGRLSAVQFRGLVNRLVRPEGVR
ncbi:MAG: hypothetical protein ACJ74M_11385 [Gaiellaceae bacterium]